MCVSLDIIIPTLNESDSVCATLNSATAETVDQVIVVDGGSDNRTARFVLATRALLIESPPGRGTQLNAAAHVSSSDGLLFLHADSCLAPGSTLTAAKALRSGFVGGCFRQRIDAEGWWYRWIEWGNAWRAEKLGWIYGDQAMFVRRDVFERMGGFKEIPLMEDLEFSRRLKKEGKTIVLDGPVVVSARRWQKQGVIYCTLRNWCFVLLYQLGVSPERLAKWYRNVR